MQISQKQSYEKKHDKADRKDRIKDNKNFQQLAKQVNNK